MQEPKHLEAHPRLNIFEAKLSQPGKNFELNRRLCRFRTSGNGCAGELVILGRLNEAVVIDYWLVGAEHRTGRDVIHLPLTGGANGVVRDRQYFRCDGCDRARSVLVFRGGAWFCAECHGLGYRSKLIDPFNRKLEELAKIYERIPDGKRPKGMHDRTFRHLQRRRVELLANLGPPREVSEAHRQVIRAEWLNVADVREMLHPDYEKVGDIFVRKSEPVPETEPAPGPAPEAAKPPGETKPPYDPYAGLEGESNWFRGHGY